MKSIVLSLCILILTVLTVFVNSFFVEKTVLRYAERVKEEDLIIIYEDFRKSEHFLGLTVSHDDLSRIEESFAEGIGADKADDRETETAMRERIADALRHLARMTGVNFDSIF